MYQSDDAPTCYSTNEEILAKLAIHDITNVDDLPGEIENKKQEILDLESKGKKAAAAKRKESLIELEELQKLLNEIKINDEATSRSSILYEEIIQQLLAHDITNVDDLPEEIENRKQEIKQLESTGKKAAVAKRKESLMELEKLQKLLEKIKIDDEAKYRSPNISDEIMQQLLAHDIAKVDDLSEEIENRKQEIRQLEIKGKKAAVAKRKESLMELEKLQELLNTMRINEDKSSSILNTNDMCEVLEEEAGQSFEQLESLSFSASVMREQQSLFDVELNEIYRHFNHALTLPDCAEKSLSILVAYFSSDEKRQVAQSQGTVGSIIPVLTQDQVIMVLKQLNAQISHEGLVDIFVKKTLSKINSLIKKETLSVHELACECASLLKYLQPVDFDFMLQLIQKTEETATLIRDKDVILLLGVTGAGKSTTIHFLAGSKMKETFVQGLEHIEPYEIASEELKSFITSPYPRSETRNINAVTVDLTKLGASQNGEVILCDSPGFGDTGGVEVDIANGICLVRALQECRSVKPVILISNQSIGDRMEGVVKLADTLVLLMPSIQHQLGAFSYVFTKISKDKKFTINPKFTHKRACLTKIERTNPGFIALLDDMIKQTSQEEVIVLDPIRDNPANILDVLYLKDAILNPREQFKDFTSSESLNKLKEQLSKNEQAFKRTFECGQVELANYKLNQLKVLRKLLSIVEVEKSHQSMLALAKHAFDTKLSNIKNIFKRILTQGNIFIQDDLRLSVLEISYLCKMEILRAQQIEEDYSNLIQLTQICVSKLLIDLQKCVMMRKDSMSSGALSSKLILLPEYGAANLDKMKQLVTAFSGVFIDDVAYVNKLQAIYMETCFFIQKLFIRLYEIAINDLQEGQFDSFVVSAEQLTELQTNYNKHLALEIAVAIDKQHCELYGKVSADLNLKVKQIINSIESITNSLQEIQAKAISGQHFKDNSSIKDEASSVAGSGVNIAKDITLAYRAYATKGLDKYYDNQVLKDGLKKIEDSINSYFIQVEQNIFPVIWKANKTTCFTYFYLQLSLLDGLRDNFQIKEKTQGIYSRIIRQIKDHITEINSAAMCQFGVIQQVQPFGSVHTDYDALKNYILGLKNATVFINNTEGLYCNELVQIEKQVQSIINDVASQLSETKLSLDSSIMLPTQLLLISGLRGIASVESLLFGQEARSCLLIKNFEAAIVEILSIINLLIDENKLMQLHDVKTFVGVFNFFEACQGNLVGEQAHNLMKLWEKVNDYIERTYGLMEKSLIVAFDKLNTFQAPTSIDENESQGGILNVARKFGSVVVTKAKASNKAVIYSQNDTFIHKESCEQIVNTLIFLADVSDNYREHIKSSKQDLTQIAASLRKHIFEEQPVVILQSWCASNTGKLIVHLQQLLADAKNMESGQYDAAIYAKLDIANKLRVLDKLLSSQDINYTKVSLQIENAIKSQSTSKKNELILLAAKQDLEGFNRLYQNISTTQPELNDGIKAILNKFLAELNDELCQLDDTIKSLILDSYSVEALRSVIMQLGTLSKASFVAELGPEDMQKQMSRMVKDVKSTLDKKILAFIKSIYGSIDKEEFKVALSNVRFLESVADLLSEEVSKDKLKSEVIKLYEKINKKVADKNSYFASLEIDAYSKTPPAIYLKQLDDLKVENELFTQFHQQLTQIISGKIKLAIAECKKENVDFDVRERLNLIKSLNKYVPVDIYGQHSDELKEVEISIQIKEEKDRQHHEEMAKADNIRGLVDELVKANYSSKAKSASDKIISMMQSAAQRYRHQVEEGNLKGIIEPLNKSWQGWQYYCFQLRFIREPKTFSENVWDYTIGKFWSISRTQYYYLLDPAIPEKICKDLLTLVSNKYNEIFNSLTILEKAPTNYDKVFSLIASGFPNLRALFELYIDYSTHKLDPRYKHFYASLIEHNSQLSEKNLLKIITSIKEFIADVQQKFNEVLDSTDFSRLNDIMKVMVKHNHTFVMIKNFASDEQFKHKLPIGFSKEFVHYIEYSEMREKLAERLIRLKNVATQKILEHKRAKSSNYVDRKEFYLEISTAFLCLKTVKPLIEQVSEKVADVNLLELQAREKIYQHLCEVKSELLELIKRIPDESSKTYTDLNTWYDNLRLVVECFESNDLAQESQLMLNQIDRALKDKLENFKKEVSQLQDDPHLLKQLIQLKSMSVHAPTFKKDVDKLIDSVLNDIKSEYQGVQHIARIGVELNKCDDEHQGVAQMIIAEHNVFKSYAIELRNEKTLRHDIEYVLERLDKNKQNSDLNVLLLRQYYTDYDKLYWSLVEPGLLRIEEAKLEIVRDTKILATADKPYNQKVLQLAAHLFAFWTLMHSSLQSEDSATERKYLLQPHAAQVISIFRLLGMDVSSDLDLTNHLVEIGTGEGKSVTMAITAMILALQNYDVDCACYSEYLSQRDHEDFADLFGAFGLRNHITYGTFNYLCERLVNQHGDVRDVVIDLIKNGSSAVNKKKVGNLRERVILIDEVDVFFNRDFYGNFYRPLAELRDDTVKQLITYVWENRLNKNALRLPNIKTSSAYLNCCQRFPGWADLIEESVKAMIVDVQTFDTPEYLVQQDKIGYREQHGISCDISYRYKTVFAYFCEYDNGEITQDSLDKRAALIIDCGAFSYAEVPKQYKCVMGVTGTLATLSNPEKSLLTDVYSINKFTYMPSVYGDNQLIFAGDNAHDVRIDKRVAHFMEIANEIKKRMLGNEIIQRPVMVFFESNEKLKDFYHSSVFRKSGINQDNVKLITEEVADDQKTGLIRQATSSGIVTLLTRGFGRGTDFKCYDDRINKQCGGMHVIQTFVSDELSEETQIKGRTARQGDPGSYSLVLASEDLERYKLNELHITQMKNTSKFYTTINKWRCDFFTAEYSESLRYVSEIKQDHDEAMLFVGALFDKDIVKIMSFLLKRNATTLSAGVGNEAKTVCLMDATGSMSGLLTKAKNTIHTMFERACDVLKAKGMDAAFELQFVVYRNYDCKEERLLQCSGWESDPNNLRQFMNTVSASGGTWEPEAVEIGLWHVNQVAESMNISQVILIGDAPPNSRELVIQGRQQYLGLKYWETTRFSRSTYVDDEVQELAKKEIPVHAFYVKSSARSSFEKIAQTTGGRCGALDIDSPAGAEQLTQVVTERILEDLGGVELVEMYREKYVKGYVASSSKSPTLLFSQKQIKETKSQQPIPISETGQQLNTNKLTP